MYCISVSVRVYGFGKKRVEQASKEGEKGVPRTMLNRYHWARNLYPSRNCVAALGYVCQPGLECLILNLNQNR